MYLIFDTETTGIPANFNAPLTDSENWPRLVQIAWQLHNYEGELVDANNFIIKPDGFVIPYSVEKIHGISTERAIQQGFPLEEVITMFNSVVEKATIIAGHNIQFDINIIGAEYHRINSDKPLFKKIIIDTMTSTVDLCALTGGKGGKFKYPKLGELHRHLFGNDFSAAHNAAADVEATARCFLELIRINLFKPKDLDISDEIYQNFLKKNPNQIQAIGLNTKAYEPLEIKDEESEDSTKEFDFEDIIEEQELEEIKDIEPIEEEILEKDKQTNVPKFVHLHLHTQYSILDGLTNIKDLVIKAKKDGMNAIAITDHGTMFGVKDFYNQLKNAGIKPILGMEAYMSFRKMEDHDRQDQKRYHLVLLAKNLIGYKNLVKLASLAYEKGFYYKPRIDAEVLKHYSEGIIGLSACLAGEISNKIMEQGVVKAEEALLKYKDIFGENFYIELQRHKATNAEMNQNTYHDQVFVNAELIKLATKYSVKMVATNDVHFLEEEDSSAHDRLICLNTGKDLDDPQRMRYTGQEWFKTQAEMCELFLDMPELLQNTVDLSNSIEQYELNHDAIMPDFKIPDGFENEDEYLTYITYEGAKKRWTVITEEIKARLDFELDTIKSMKFPGYFLIVWDFLRAAREIGVVVGPGRGSAAGSTVAFCLKITDIDPLKYNLLFERFLNKERISMPDIDIDFDDEGRDKILRWVKEKYGAKRVAHITTFGSMAAKSSIRDVARIQKMDLRESDRLAKLIPEKVGTTLANAFKLVKELNDELISGSKETKSVLEYAVKLEGCIRNTGTHACGIIIGKDDLDNYLPINTVKNTILDFATQYDGSHVESVGLLKMDFLGLKTLSVIKDAIENIRLSKNKIIKIDEIDLNDKETYELYSRGDTIGLFQFESEGMKMHLQNLKPSKIEDLIAMVSLYRPGPMEYIGSFIARKQGKENITYDIPEMEEFLKETYGITVYQEQVMLLSRKIAGFSGFESDSLRKAMGKKIIHMMDELKEKFIIGGLKNGHKIETLSKIWKDWEAFAKYAFNKSHATCYTYVSFQTAFLKTHYPAEFMASVLSHNFKDIKKLNYYLNECQRMKLKVLGPDINESYSGFTVNKKGEIRFGLSGVKGVGEAAVEALISERDKKGNFKDVFDFVKRVNLRTVNKKTLESLATVGGFDDFQDAHRAQYFFMEDENDSIFLEKIIKFGSKYQENENSNQISLFGNTEDNDVNNPDFPNCEPWSDYKKLKFEKELLGFYLSGHPLDEYKDAFVFFAKDSIENVKRAISLKLKKSFKFGGIITKSQLKISKNNKPYAIFTIEDLNDSMDIFLFAETLMKYKHLLNEEVFIYVDASIVNSSRNNGEIDFKINDMILLDEVVEKFTKEVQVQIDIKKIDEDGADEFIKIVKNNSGKTKIKIYFANDTQYASFKSGKYKVHIKDFVAELDKLDFVKYKLLSNSLK